MNRSDDFATRRAHLGSYSDAELHQYFWRLVEQLVSPLVSAARTHTSPSIERSVLLRMGFSSPEAHALVEQLARRNLLSQGAGRLVLQLAQHKGMGVREAGLALLDGRCWESLAQLGAAK